jgi:hypothetical protein
MAVDSVGGHRRSASPLVGPHHRRICAGRILAIRKDALTGHHRLRPGQDAIAKTIWSVDPEGAGPPPEEGRTAIDDPMHANPSMPLTPNYASGSSAPAAAICRSAGVLLDGPE